MWKSQNTRYIFSPVAAAESLPTCSTESRPCAPSKSWSTREPSSACASPACRFGTTCGRSAPTILSAPECSQTFENTAMTLSLPGAFLAKIFHAREKARAYAAREADFGRSLRVSFAKFDPATYSWKIPRFLFQGDWATFSPTWPRYGMMVRGECYQLPPWVQDTGATAFGGLSGDGIEAEAESTRWPTPTCAGLDGGSNSRRAARARGRYIEGAGAKSATWPTPCATDHKGSGKNGADRDRLDYAVERGKTKSHIYPTVGTKTMGGCSGSFAKLKKLEEDGLLTEEERRAMSSHLTGGKDPERADCGMLNPDWVEWLMGWPFGWTDIAITSGVFYWLDLSDDPADWTPPLMARITTRKKHRVPRINTLGNGQVPLCAAIAFVWGFEILREVEECFQDVDEETSKLMRKAKAALEKAGGAE